MFFLDEQLDELTPELPAGDSTSTGPLEDVNDILGSVSDIVSGVLGDSETPDLEETPTQSNTVVIIQPEATEAPPPEGEDQDTWVYDYEYGVQVYATNPITSGTGLKGVLLDVLGPYDAIVVEHRYQNPNSSSYSYVREIQPDFPWLCSAAVFLALLWSVFAIGGRLICRK